MSEQPTAAVAAQAVAIKVNPYVAELAARLCERAPDLTGDAFLDLAQYVLDELVTPKNARIHDLSIELARLKADVGRLGKVLDRHSPGEWHKDKESEIDCATRLLSPVRDDAAKRDRP